MNKSLPPLESMRQRQTGMFSWWRSREVDEAGTKVFSRKILFALKVFSIVLVFSYLFLKGFHSRNLQDVSDLVRWNLAFFYHSNDYTHSLSFELSEKEETPVYCLSHIEYPTVLKSAEPLKQVDVYLGLLLHANEKSLVESWVKETIKLVKNLTERRLDVFISIIEDGCTQDAKAQLQYFSSLLRELQVGFLFILGKSFVGYPHRIYTLSRIRNCVLLPLIRQEILATHVLMFNDVTYQFERVLDLITDGQSYDMKCGIDYFISTEKTLQLYDLWVMRDMDGDIPRAKYPFFNIYDNERFVRKLPFRAYCCWGGIALLNGSLFRQGIRFRGLPKRPSSGYHSQVECPQSEINFLCDDVWEMRGRAEVFIYSSLFSVYRADEVESVSTRLNKIQSEQAQGIVGISPPQDRPRNIVCCPWIEGITNFTGATTLCYSNYPIYKLPEISKVESCIVSNRICTEMTSLAGEYLVQ
ncbi:hypothetical protein GpartN1_g1798.t1 [Galdieria partita]|uniref:Uncharacterized protein n=1 Tax=Galdieria partita TaxID=83374 RepID=A0A9C7PUA1_9RHOD|nr:hypothetical protein GpartN1_g1798.t1 [Galdieria partita]